jgi:hypothetical protein
MIITIHITVALLSLAATFYAFRAPSITAIRVSSGSVGLTLLSGVILVVGNGQHMLRACAMGLVFVAVSALGIIAANRKLAAENAPN